MDFIERFDFHGKRHAIAKRFEYGRAMTWCGIVLSGRTGACIATLIDCERCRAGMRKEGYTV